MAYCPDDGIKMTAICLDYHACYDCSECDAHWTYVDGTWETANRENCLIHTHCTSCISRTKLRYNAGADF